MQALQGATLVGRDVIVPGNRLDDRPTASAQGGFELDRAADAVKVEILDAARPRGRQRSTSAPQSAGAHSFDWPAGTARPTASGCTLPRHRHQRQRQRRGDAR